MALNMALMRLAAIALLISLALPSWSGTARSACNSLCGDWRLDVAASDSPEQQLDAAFRQFKEPKVRQPRFPSTDDLEALRRAADEEALGPILNRPRSAELREELERALRQPGSLAFTAAGADIRITTDGQSLRGVTPGEHSTRVDRYGTARIESRWRGPLLAISEKYDRRNQQETTYAVGSDGALRVVRVIARPGLPRVTVRSVYRRP
jgi:hypothetical protein